MPWDRSKPTDPKYRTPEHRKARAAMKAQLDRDGQAWCAQPVCLMRSRLILPGMDWCAGHDDTGTRYIGPVHGLCNRQDGARRARQRQTVTAWRM